MTRFDDADAIFDARLAVEGVASDRPSETSQDIDRVLHAIGDEGKTAFLAAVMYGDPVSGSKVVNPAELFGQGFLVGVAAVQISGVAWAEWLLTAKEIPAINLGVSRAAACRIIAGGHE